MHLIKQQSFNLFNTKTKVSTNTDISLGQVVNNAVTNFLLFIVSTLLGLWFTPFLIKNLGVEVYGLVPLANSITNYLSLITLSINGGVGRFLAIELENKESNEANKTLIPLCLEVFSFQ